MGIEDDLFNTIKYANFSSGAADPTKMIRAILIEAQLNMLKKIRANIDSQIGALDARKMKTSGLDPFKILGVDDKATREEVERAYRRRASEAHPDVGGSHEQMVKVNAAYEAIKLYKGWK